MMLQDQCISITEFKRNASTVIKDLKKQGKRVIFINNKPVAVLSDIDQHPELRISDEREFTFDPPLDPKVVLEHFGRL